LLHSLKRRESENYIARYASRRCPIARGNSWIVVTLKYKRTLILLNQLLLRDCHLHASARGEPFVQIAKNLNPTIHVRDIARDTRDMRLLLLLARNSLLQQYFLIEIASLL